MKKKPKSPKKREKSEKVPKISPAPIVQQPIDDENPFDFGGLPDRDLKKNLGCG